MRPKTFTFTPDAADRNGLFLSARPAGSGALTLDGALVSGGVGTMDIPRHVSIYAGTNESGITFTVTGTDRYGAALTETITGPNNTTVYGNYNFKTVTGVSCSSRPSNVIEVGSGNELETQPVPIGQNLSYSVELSSGASLTHTFQYCIENPFDSGFNEHTSNWFEDGGATNVNVDGASSGPVGAVRLKIESYSSGTAYLMVYPSRFGV